MKNVAIVLAAGSGKRMNSDVKKQYIEINGKPIIYYTLHAFEQNDVITDVILVTGAEDIEYCRSEIVSRFGFAKVRAVIVGGRERYNSVMAGIKAIGEMGGCDYVYIHDGARPFVNDAMIARLDASVRVCDACIAGVKSKDTVKVADSEDYIVSTPNRNLVWNVQTPQVFGYELIKEAYGALEAAEDTLDEQGIVVTDDAMVVETWTAHKVKLVEGSYENIKITTPDDIVLANAILSKK